MEIVLNDLSLLVIVLALGCLMINAFRPANSSWLVWVDSRTYARTSASLLLVDEPILLIAGLNGLAGHHVYGAVLILGAISMGTMAIRAFATGKSQLHDD